jgi:hypothetical protein
MLAASSLDSALIAVSVVSAGELEDAGTAITEPPGATDGVLSEEQYFVVSARVSATINAQDVTATLEVPGGFNVVGNPERNLGNGAGGVLNTDFQIFASGTAAPVDTITVTFTGTDINTTAPLDTVDVLIPVEVVTPANLSIAASVTAPPDAVDRTVTVGTPFTVSATVTNSGGAGVDGQGALDISVPVAAGYALQAGEPSTKAFTVGTPVDWVVVAAPQPRGPDDITITISTAPADENSGVEADVTTGEAVISMVTEGSVISVTDVSGTEVSRPASVQAGATGVDMLAFEMEYAAEPNAANARIDTIALTILGADGRALAASAVGRTLSRVAVSLDGGTPYGTASTASNPVVVSFTSATEDIVPNDVRSALVTLDVSGNPAAEEVSVQVRSGGIVIRDTGSGQVLGVVDAATQQALDGRLTSDPLIILSNQFEEYVHNYPNPFRAGSEVTKITYFLSSPGSVEMKVYSISGELVYEETVPDGDARTTAGTHELEWDGRNGQGEIVRNGIYVCVLNAGGNSATFRIAVAK